MIDKEWIMCFMIVVISFAIGTWVGDMHKDCPQYKCSITKPGQPCLCMNCNIGLEESEIETERYKRFYHSCSEQRAEYKEEIRNLYMESRLTEVYCEYRIKRIYDRWNKSLIPIDWDNVVMTK